jgi:hypothetical protein
VTTRVPLHPSGIASVGDADVQIDFVTANRTALLRRLKSTATTHEN